MASFVPALDMKLVVVASPMKLNLTKHVHVSGDQQIEYKSERVNDDREFNAYRLARGSSFVIHQQLQSLFTFSRRLYVTTEVTISRQWYFRTLCVKTSPSMKSMIFRRFSLIWEDFQTLSYRFQCRLCSVKCIALNAILSKVGRFASEEVVLNLLRAKCLPVLLDGVESCQ